MNIILSSRFCQHNGSAEVCMSRLLVTAVLAVFVLSGSAFWFGYHAGQSDEMANSRELHDTLGRILANERKQLSTISDRNQKHLNALAMRLGQMQAQVQRLDALGERLVELGGLSANEFDFHASPALGGPELDQDGELQNAHELVTDLDTLTRQIADRDRKLSLLESMLMYSDFRDDVIPQGKPVRTGWLSSKYGMRTDPFNGKKTMHHGVDFAGKKGSIVISVAAGVVTHVGKREGYGMLVEIAHGGGYSTRYAHNETALVLEGEVVTRGQEIATMGSSGRSTGPHVHFEVKKNGKAVNPTRFLAQNED